MIFIGVDPGRSGAMAVVNGRGQVLHIVKNNSTERDLWQSLCDWAALTPRSYAVIESVHSMPKQGVASSFKFGVSYGFLRGLLIASGIRFTEVSPVKWQTAMRCRTKGDKNVSKARAQQLFPRLHIVHANADALLLAEYARTNWAAALLTTSPPELESP